MKAPRTLWEVPAHNLVQAQARILADMARELDPTDHKKLSRGATPAGDEERLRGIPVIAGTRGAIRGTIPHVNGIRTS